MARSGYVMRTVVRVEERENKHHPGVYGSWDVLECGHSFRTREADTTAEAIRWAFMAASGKPRKRRCHLCAREARAAREEAVR